jgi:hypothetical protein
MGIPRTRVHRKSDFANSTRHGLRRFQRLRMTSALLLRRRATHACRRADVARELVYPV